MARQKKAVSAAAPTEVLSSEQQSKMWRYLEISDVELVNIRHALQGCEFLFTKGLEKHERDYVLNVMHDMRKSINICECLISDFYSN